MRRQPCNVICRHLGGEVVVDFAVAGDLPRFRREGVSGRLGLDGLFRFRCCSTSVSPASRGRLFLTPGSLDTACFSAKALSAPNPSSRPFTSVGGVTVEPSPLGVDCPPLGARAPDARHHSAAHPVPPVESATAVQQKSAMLAANQPGALTPPSMPAIGPRTPHTNHEALQQQGPPPSQPNADGVRAPGRPQRRLHISPLQPAA